MYKDGERGDGDGLSRRESGRGGCSERRSALLLGGEGGKAPTRTGESGTVL